MGENIRFPANAALVLSIAFNELDECREIRCIFQRGGINPDQVDDRDCTSRKTASPELEGEGWPPGHATGT
jgi:hypothetical protein